MQLLCIVKGPPSLAALLARCRPSRHAWHSLPHSEGFPPPWNCARAGPDDFERCVAAGQLAWALRQLGGRHLGSAIGPALPLVLAAVEDPSPAVQACGLWALRHVALEGPPAGLR